MVTQAHAIEVRCPDCGGYHAAPENPDFDALLTTACTEVGETSQRLYHDFRLAERGGRWGVDTAAAILTWTHADGSAARAEYQFAGGWIEETGSFLWGWDYPHKTHAETAGMARVRGVGEARGFPVLTTPYLITGEEDSWHLSKVAAYLLHWPGVYRAKVNDKAWAYFAFAQPHWEV